VGDHFRSVAWTVLISLGMIVWESYSLTHLAHHHRSRNLMKPLLSRPALSVPYRKIRHPRRHRRRRPALHGKAPAAVRYQSPAVNSCRSVFVCHDGVGVSYEVVRVSLEDGGVSAVPFDLRRD